jgi:hypothetical protein
VAQQDADVECWKCKGEGICLARLTLEQDSGFAKRGLAIPKVECWICNGTGWLPAKVEAV